MSRRDKEFDAIRAELHLISENLRYLLRWITYERYTVTVKQVNFVSIYDFENQNYKIDLMGFYMPNGITAGASGTFAAVLNDNGSPIALPSGSSFSWTADDTTATPTPSADTLSCVVNIPGGDPATSVTVTAATTDPNGNAVSGSLTVPVTAEAQTFTVTVSQTA